MIISLTWANFALIVSTCLVVYYLIVGLAYYRVRLKMSAINEESNTSLLFSTNENSTADTKHTNLFGEEINKDFQSSDDQTEFNPEAQDFADEIVAYTSSCDENITKEKVIQDIHRIIQKYPSLKDSDYKYELNQLIAISTENYCSIHVSADELSELWKS